jgi:hypothetical protein
MDMKNSVRSICAIAFLGFGSLMMAAEALPTASGPVTFSKDIAPILQRSCQNCHQPASVAPMSLITYKDARPWAKSIKARVLIRDKRGAMPPWYIEKNIGIQHYKNDNSLSDLEIAKIVNWADSGAPEGNPADMPPAPKARRRDHMGYRKARSRGFYKRTAGKRRCA